MVDDNPERKEEKLEVKDIGEAGNAESDVEELKEVFSVLRSEVPGLLIGLIGPLREIMDLTYNPDRARERARAIASFYKELVDQGIPEGLALKLTKEHFMNPMSVIKYVIKGEED